jgi:NitT/TauT family transport system permease protein
MRRLVPSRAAMLVFAWRFGLIAILLVAWELAAGRLFNEFWSSRPSLIGTRIAEMALSGELARHSWATISEAGLGLLLGALVGVPIGILLAQNPRLAKVLDPVVMGLYGLPRVALAPLFILWFGIGLESKVVMSLSMVLFVFLLNTTEGVRSIDRDLTDLLRTMRAGRLYTLRHVMLPAILPWIIAACRIGVGLSLVGAVVGELSGANRGLGWYVAKTGGQLDTTGAFAALTVLLVLAVLANQLIIVAEERAMKWRR